MGSGKMNRSKLLEKLGQMLMSDSHYYKAVSLSRYAGEKWAIGNYAESEETYLLEVVVGVAFYVGNESFIAVKTSMLHRSYRSHGILPSLYT